MQAARFDIRLAFQLLHEMIPPGETALKAGQTAAPAAAGPFGLPRGGRLRHLAHRQAAQRQMRRQARTGPLARKGRRHASAVGLAPRCQETVQRGQPARPPARLPVQAAVIGQPQHPRRGNHARLCPRHAGQRGQVFNGARHEPVAQARPAIPPLQAADHTRLWQFDPVDPRLPRPGPDPAVARKGPQIAGFLVADDPADPMRAAQLAQHLNRIAHPHHQRRAKPAQRRTQVGQAIFGKGPLAGRCIGQRPIVGFHDVNGQNRAHPRRQGKGRMVGNPKIALEPDQNIHGTRM